MTDCVYQDSKALYNVWACLAIPLGLHAGPKELNVMKEATRQSTTSGVCGTMSYLITAHESHSGKFVYTTKVQWAGSLKQLQALAPQVSITCRF